MSSVNEITYFAKTNFRNQERKFGIKLDDRRRHMYVMGKTGMGKTELLKNMIIQDLQNGHGLAFLDPHGDSVEEILECIPASRINDVIYFNPADLDHPIAFNILENVVPEYKHLVADGLMGVFTKIWANMWSARMEYILRNCILALLDVPGNTLLGVMRLLVDKEYRRKIVDKVRDPVVKTFWVEEYANYNDRFRTEAIAPIQNKVGQFLSSAVIRNIVGQTKSTIDPREIMDNGKILLMNLSKGKIGEDNSNLLGAMMVTKLQLAAMSRVDTPEKERRDFFLYVDEFQNFATESFADIMSEARKYRLCLILAHQYIAQLVSGDFTRVRDAIFGNVGTIVCFRVGAADAYFLIKEFEPYFLEEDLVNLNKFDIYLKLMIDGTASRPFSATTLPPMSEGKVNLKNKESVIKVSRERYTNSKVEVEDKIIRWLELDEMFKKQAEDEKVAGDESIYKAGVTTERVLGQRRGEIKGREEDQLRLAAICDNCEQKTYLSFVPQPHLNVFCKDCLKLFKAGQIDVRKLKFHNLHLSKSKESAVTEKPIEQPVAAVKSQEKQENQENQENQEKGPLVVEKKKKETVDFLSSAKENLKKDDGLSLAALNYEQPQSFKSGKEVKPGEKVTLKH